MATTVTLNGQTYSVPAVGAARTWGTSLSNYLIAISTSVLQKSGGAFTLTADANFGTTYGVISAYFKSYDANAAGNIATTGIVRLGNAESIAWRNSANAANVALKVNASDRLEFDGVAVPTISSTDTLTNKTLTSPVINTPTGIVKGDIGLGNVDNTSDATKNAATATLTNKTLTKPIVDQIDVTQGASATTPASGKSALYVSTADSKLHVVDSSGNDVPVGSGSSGRNYFSDWNDSTKNIGTVTNSLGDTLASSDRTANKTTWGSSDTSLLTIAKSSDTSLRESTNYLITEAGSSNGAFIESPLVTLDGVDLGKPVSVRFDVTGNAADGDYQVYICRYDSGDVLQERIVVAGNASTTSPYSAKLPTGTTKFQGFFIAGSTATDQYSVRILSNNNSAASIRIDSLYVGPDTVVQGSAVGDWQAFSPTVSNTTNNTSAGFWRPNGDSMEVLARVVWTGAGAGSAFAMTIPNSNLIDSNKVPGISGYLKAGSAMWADSGVGYKALSLFAASTSTLQFAEIGANNDWDGSQAASGDYLAIQFKVPIVGWSSNVTMANRAVEEFAFTTGTWDAADSTTGYGSAGVAMGGALTSTREKVITWQNACQPTDKYFVELSEDRVQWYDADGFVNTGASIAVNNVISSAGSFATSSGIYLAKSDTNKTKVNFARYASIANDDAPTIEWSSSLYWRVRKVSGGASVGFPVGARNIVGDTTGTTVPTGYIGETLKVTDTTGLAAASIGNDSYTNTALTVALTSAGTYLVGYKACVGGTTGNIGGRLSLSVDGAVSGSVSYATIGSSYLFATTSVTVSAAQNLVVQLRKSAGADLQMYGEALTGGLTNPDNQNHIFAVRIA